MVQPNVPCEAFALLWRRLKKIWVSRSAWKSSASIQEGRVSYFYSKWLKNMIKSKGNDFLFEKAGNYV